MPESLNVQVAHKLSEKPDAERRKHRWEEIAEVVEVLCSRSRRDCDRVERLQGIRVGWALGTALRTGDGAAFRGQ
jgi:hypothetical protein